MTKPKARFLLYSILILTWVWTGMVASLNQVQLSIHQVYLIFIFQIVVCLLALFIFRGGLS